jgi:hypothetical protein
MVVGKNRGWARVRIRSLLSSGVALAIAVGAVAGSTGARWCLGFGSLGPVRTGMTVEQVLRLADWPGMERKQPAGECWYLRYHAGGADFDLMIIRGIVVRIELKGASTLRTLSGASLASSEAELARLYGAGLERQPHKYDPGGHTLTLKSSDGSLGLRFETSHGKVTAIQSGPWEHLHYVEGCG